MQKTKLFINFFIISVLTSITSYASEIYKTNEMTYFPIQFSLWDGVRNWPAVKNVTGIRLGVPYATTTDDSDEYMLYGMELAVISESDAIDGMQAAWLIMGSRDINGVQIAWTNIAGRTINGLQLAFFNQTLNNFNGFQISSGNINEKESNAIQIGLLNYQGYDSRGAQLGVLNNSINFDGLQIGLVNLNYHKDSLVFQFGLINYMENGFLPIFPLFNFSIRTVPRDIEVVKPVRP